MHPAYSVLLFTTVSGAGYGLLFVLALGLPAGLLPASGVFGFVATATALALATAGLISSTFHLGHPERAWRAFSQWRSSWLSREGVAAVLTYLPAVPLALLWGLAPESSWLAPLAGLSAFGAVATVFCTGRIYSSLPTIPEWRHRLTTPLYLLFALASGLLVLVVLTALSGAGDPVLVAVAAVSLWLAWMTKALYWSAIGSSRPHPLDRPGAVAGATGLDQDTEVRLLDPPHTSDNYLMREMGYRVARKHAGRLRRIALLSGACAILVLAPCGWLAPGFAPAALSVLALLSGMAGILVERWLFFAEARHVVRLYYGEGAT